MVTVLKTNPRKACMPGPCAPAGGRATRAKSEEVLKENTTPSTSEEEGRQHLKEPVKYFESPKHLDLITALGRFNI